MGSLAQPSQAATASAAAAAAKAAGEAVKALLKWKNNQSSSSEKGQLLPGGDDFLYLYLTLEKIPQKSRTNPFKIPLPHPILDPSSEFCLIIDDRRHQSKEDVKKIVKSQNLPITKVLRLSKLKSNYKPHEAKRKLCESFDAFLVDRNIVHLLPKLLGKFFFKKKKLPLPVDLSHKNLKEQVERISGCGLLYMRTGTCCVMKVAKMEDNEEEIIVENVVQAIDGVVKVVPKGWSGIRSLHLKVSGSLALPIYQALPDVKLRIEGMKESEARSVEDQVVEVGEESNQEIQDKKNVKHKKKKGGRIHEVKYMDFGVDDGDVLAGGKEEVNDEFLKKKNESDELLVVSDNDDEGKAMELVEQKGGVIEDENGNGEKRSKGKASLKKSKNKEEKNMKEKEVKKEKHRKRESPRNIEQTGGNGKKVLNEGSRTKKTKRSQNVA